MDRVLFETFDVRTTIGMLNPGIACSRKKLIMLTSLGGYYSIPQNINMNTRQSVAISACRVHSLLHGDIMSFPDTRYPLS